MEFVAKMTDDYCDGKEGLWNFWVLNDIQTDLKPISEFTTTGDIAPICSQRPQKALELWRESTVNTADLTCLRKGASEREFYAVLM